MKNGDLAGGYIRRMDHVVWKVVDGKGILLNLENGAYFDVDPVGLSIWLSCDGVSKLDKIALEASKKFNADLKRVRSDAEEFIGELKRAKLIEITSAPSRASVKA